MVAHGSLAYIMGGITSKLESSTRSKEHQDANMKKYVREQQEWSVHTLVMTARDVTLHFSFSLADLYS